MFALIRHGAMVCRIVNWKGVNAYSVTSPLNIWTKFGVWLASDHLVVHLSKWTTTPGLILALSANGAMVCQHCKLKGLNAYSVTSTLNIWSKFGVWLPTDKKWYRDPRMKDAYYRLIHNLGCQRE